MGPRRGTDFSRVAGGSWSPVGQEGWRILLSRRRQRRTGLLAWTPGRALAGRLEAPSAPAPSLFFPNKFLTQIGCWIRLSLACWHCLEKNLVSGRKCKLSKWELVELSWNGTFVAGRRAAPRSTIALDSPEEPLVLLPREPCWGMSSLRQKSQAFSPFPFFLNVCFSAFVVGVLSLLSGLRLQDTDLDPNGLGAYILDGIWSLCFLLLSTWF